ncbi:MAG: C40 family peptidase [Ignavibacteria bacterium]
MTFYSDSYAIYTKTKKAKARTSQTSEGKTVSKKKSVKVRKAAGSSKTKKSSVVKKSKKKTVGKRSRSHRKTIAVHTQKKEVINEDSLSVNPDDLPALEDDAEDLPEQTQPVNVSELLDQYVVSKQYDAPSDSVNMREKIIMEIIKFLDTPYKFGGNTNKGIDCSAFTNTIFSNSFSMALPRTAREQYQLGTEVDSKDNLKFGDLIFFNTRQRVKPGHVAIYIGDNMFAHSSSKSGVMVSSLDIEFYSKRFLGGRRIELSQIH